MKPRLQLKQTVKPKLSVRTRLIYAAAGVAIAAIIAGVVVFLYSNLGTSEKAKASVSGDYRSIGLGVWTGISIWEKYNGSLWLPAVTAPNSTSGTITIQSGTVVTISSAVTLDQVIINSGGELDISSAGTLTVANGVGTDLDVSGILKNAGIISISTGAAVAFENGGKYQHTRDGGSIPYSTWNTGASCEILGVVVSKPEHLNQAFYNFTWNSTGQTGVIDLNGILTTVNGDLNLISTGSSNLVFDVAGNNSVLAVGGNINVQGGTTYICTNGSDVINLAGNYIQTAGSFNFDKAGGTLYGSNAPVVNVTGNMTISGGTINLSQCDANNATKGNGQLYLKGNLALSGSGLMTETSALSRGQVYFNGTSVQYFTSASSVTQKVDFTVNSGAILRMDNQVITGTGNFSLLGGGGLMMGSANGITSSSASGNVQSTGTRSYSTTADYTYNGVVAQNSGSGLPATVHNLTLDNSNGLTLTGTVAVSNILTLTSGIITTGVLEVNVTNISTSAISGYSSSNYVNGNLRRNINTVGTYYYPVGTSSQYEFANLTMNDLSGVSNILVNFNNPNTGTTPIPSLCVVNGTQIVALLNYGFWNITPNSTLTSGNYNLTVMERGYTNGGTNPTAYALITRPTTSSDWISSGTHTNNTQTEIGGTVTAVRTALSVFGNFAIGFGAFTLPIQLVFFNAASENNSSVHLAWETASEHNNNFFVVERGTDGIKWRSIDTLKGAGNSQFTIDYSDDDLNPIKGQSYYRLKQCDLNLTSSYSNVVSVKLDAEATSQSNDFKAYPNPTLGVINISVPEVTDNTMIRVFDIKGQLIKEIKPVKGEEAQVDLTGRSPGIYLVKVGTGGSHDVSKQIVLNK